MAINLPTIVQRISVQDGPLRGLGTRFAGVGKALGVAVAGGALAATAAVGAFTAKGVSGAISVERGLREVNTLLGVTGDEAQASLEGMQGELRGLSDTIGIAQDELVGGLYQAISAGVPRDNAFEFLETAGKAAIAGVTDVATAVDGITTNVNAFGLEADDAERVADSMFAAVAGGKTTFEELSRAMSTVAPAAAAAGVSLEEINAGVATLTSGGASTSEATTQMRAALVGLQRPSEELTAIFQAAGHESAQAALESEGLAASLQIVSDAAEGDNGKLTKLLGSVEAVGAAQVLAGTGAEKMAAELERQEGSAGAMGDAFEEMEQSTSRAWTKFTTQVSNVGIALGAQLLPPLNRLLEVVSAALLPALEQIGPVAERIIGWFTGMAGGSDEVGGKLEGFAATAADIRDKVQGVVAAIAGAFESRMGQIRETLETVRGRISSIMESIASITSGVLEVVMFLWETVGDDLVGFVTATFGAIFRVIDGVLSVISGVIETVLGIVTGDWSRAWEGIKSIFSGVWQVIRGILDAAMAAIRGIIGAGLSLIAGLFGAVWGQITGTVSRLWNDLTAAFGRGVERIGTAVSEGVGNLVEWFRELPGRIFDAIGDLAGKMVQLGKDIISGLISGVGSMAGELASSVGDMVHRNTVGRVKGLLGANSPSRVFADIGRDTGEGFVLGLEAMQGKVGRAAGTLAERAAGAMGELGAPDGTAGTRRDAGAAGPARGPVHVDVRAYNPGEAARAFSDEIAWLDLSATVGGAA